MHLNAFHPFGVGFIQVEITDKEIEILQKRGPLSRYMEMASAMEVLRKPLLIFENMKRNGFEHALCYIGKPMMFVQQSEYSCPSGFVFAVYINGANIVYEWRLEREDPKKPNHPVDWRSRYGEKKWTDTNS